MTGQLQPLNILFNKTLKDHLKKECKYRMVFETSYYTPASKRALLVRASWLKFQI